MQNKEHRTISEADLWDDWMLFKTTGGTTLSIQLKKQGAKFKNDKYVDFTYRSSTKYPPSIQEFYEGVINGIIKRQQLGLYRGDYFFYQELQHCLHEFLKSLNYKVDILIEIFQAVTGLNLTKEQFPNIVVPCSFCQTNVYITYHCKKCFCSFYCDKTCMKNHKASHEADCVNKIKITPTILYPLQVELHCGGDLGEDVEIYYEHEMKLSLKYRGQRFIQNLIKVLNKNSWLRSNYYSIEEDKERNCAILHYEQLKDIDLQEGKEVLLYDDNIQNEEDLYLMMPVVQEMKVIFLNMGGILQDIIKEKYQHYFHFVHIYYIPI